LVGLDELLVWLPTTCFAAADVVALLPGYTVWIEAERWSPEDWDHHDGNTNVLVTFDDGARWGATFVTYANVASLTNKNQRTGECFSGKYFWVSDVLLVDMISRERVEEIVQHLLATGEFERVFVRYPVDDDD
jgi:hypothetical protein